MTELLQSETFSTELKSVPKIATFAQLIELADTAQSRPTVKDLEDWCIDKYGVQNYESLLQDPAAWRRTFVGLTHPL